MALVGPGSLCACRPWPVQPECCCDDWPSTWDEISGCDLPGRELTTEEKRALWAAAQASERLHVLSGYRWGLCEDLVRPCGPMRCRTPAPRWGHYGAPTAPYVRAGMMRNGACGCACSDCEVRCSIPLPGPVNEVLKVTVDGEELEEFTDWFTGGDGSLVKVEGCWPHAQDMRAPCGQEESFCVRYLRGYNPAGSISAIRAVSALACRYYHDACGTSCPALRGATRVSRGGVEWEYDSTQTSAPRTGVAAADEWLEMVNPAGRRSPARVYTPDLPRWTFRGASEMEREREARETPQ